MDDCASRSLECADGADSMYYTFSSMEVTGADGEIAFIPTWWNVFGNVVTYAQKIWFWLSPVLVILVALGMLIPPPKTVETNPDAGEKTS